MSVSDVSLSAMQALDRSSINVLILQQIGKKREPLQNNSFWNAFIKIHTSYFIFKVSCRHNVQFCHWWGNFNFEVKKKTSVILQNMHFTRTSWGRRGHGAGLPKFWMNYLTQEWQTNRPSGSPRGDRRTHNGDKVKNAKNKVSYIWQKMIKCCIFSSQTGVLSNYLIIWQRNKKNIYWLLNKTFEALNFRNSRLKKRKNLPHSFQF